MNKSKEEIVEEFIKWHSSETTFAYGVPDDRSIAEWWIETFTTHSQNLAPVNDPLGIYTVAHGKNESKDYIRGASDQFQADEKKVKELFTHSQNREAETYRRGFEDGIADAEEKIDEVCTNPLHDIKHPELGGLSYHEYEEKLNKTMNTMNTPDTEVEKAEEIVMQEIHNYGAWLLNNPNAEPLVRRAEKSQRAKHVVKTIFSSRDTYWKERVRKEEQERLLKMFDEFNDEIEFEEMAQMVRRFIQALTPEQLEDK